MTRFAEQGPVSLDEVYRLLREKGLIPAIKYYREYTGVGLKEAKEAVEALVVQQRNSYTTQSAQQDPDNFDALRSILREQGKIAAIKYYRQQTGMSLQDAKAAVEALQIQPTRFHTPPVNEYQSGLVDPDELRRLLREQGKIVAIKYYRQSTGIGLKEAKDAVDYIAAQMGS